MPDRDGSPPPSYYDPPAEVDPGVIDICIRLPRDAFDGVISDALWERAGKVAESRLRQDLSYYELTVTFEDGMESDWDCELGSQQFDDDAWEEAEKRDAEVAEVSEEVDPAIRRAEDAAAMVLENPEPTRSARRPFARRAPAGRPEAGQ